MNERTTRGRHAAGLAALAAGAGLLLLSACTSPAPETAAPTATALPPATATPVVASPTAPARLAESSCVTCHTDADQLVAVADPIPTPVVSAAQTGEG